MGGKGVWNFVEDDVVGEEEDKKGTGIRGFVYKLFEEEVSGVGWGVNRSYMGIHIWTIQLVCGHSIGLRS